MREVNDLITLNLDIERFAKDVIAQSEGPELLARLLARHARRIRPRPDVRFRRLPLRRPEHPVEPLYTACLEGMRGFLDDEERIRSHAQPQDYLSDFRKTY